MIPVCGDEEWYVEVIADYRGIKVEAGYDNSGRGPDIVIADGCEVDVWPLTKSTARAWIDIYLDNGRDAALANKLAVAYYALGGGSRDD